MTNVLGLITSGIRNNSTLVYATLAFAATISVVRSRSMGNSSFQKIRGAANTTKPMLTPLEDVEQVTPLVMRVMGQNPGKFTLLGTNTYLIGKGNGSRILVDTGQGMPEYIRLLKQVLVTQGSTVTISDVIITHWHHDHVDGIPDIRATFPDAKVWKLPLHSSSDDTCSEMDPTGTEYFSLRDGQTFSVAGAPDATISVIHSPGHTKDHASLLLNDGQQEYLFSGDCVLGEGSAVFESLHEYMMTLERLKERINKPNQLIPILPGHGPVVQDGCKKITEYIHHRLARETQILNALQACGENNGLTPGEIVEIVYKEQNLGSQLKKAAKNSVLQHLTKLELDNKVVRGEGTKWEPVPSARI